MRGANGVGFGTRRAVTPSLSESGLAGFSGFRFARLARFVIAGDFAKTNRDKRSPFKDEFVKSYNPANPDSDEWGGRRERHPPRCGFPPSRE